MVRILNLSITLLVLDTSLIAGILIRRIITNPTDLSVLDLGPLFLVAGALTALVAFLVNLRRSRSEDVLKAASTMLEKAYEMVQPETGSSTPSGSRHAWLAAARLIATAEQLKIDLNEPSHEKIYAVRKEYLRTKLYELIFPSSEGLPSTFYAESPETMLVFTSRDQEPLSESSLAYLYRFIRWPDGVEDPIGDVPRFSDQEIQHMRNFGPRNLGNLLQEVRRLERTGE